MQVAIVRLLLASSLLLCVVLGAATAEAQQGDGERCVAAFDAVQTHRNAGKLVAARAEAAQCADVSCPDAIRGKCVTWLEEITASIPSILVSAKDAAGGDVSDVRISSAGQVIAEELDGRPIALDPGPHELRFERQGSPPVTQQVVLQAGVKSRPVTVTFARSTEPTPSPAATSVVAPPPIVPPPASAEDDAPFAALFWIGVATAGAGLLAGAVAGGVAIEDKSALDKQCDAFGCTEDDISGSQVAAHVSTAGFALAGAGAVLAGVALALWWPFGEEAGPSAALRVTPTGIALEGSF